MFVHHSECVGNVSESRQYKENKHNDNDNDIATSQVMVHNVRRQAPRVRTLERVAAQSQLCMRCRQLR